jgi:hypothetical protein
MWCDNRGGFNVLMSEVLRKSGSAPTLSCVVPSLTPCGERTAMDTPYDLQTLGHLPMAVRSPHGVRDGTTQLNVGALPDFLRTSLMSTLNPPRLSHHIHDIPGAYEDLWNLAERLGPAKPRGLNKHEIEQIPSFRFSERVQKETNRKCVVCMGEYNNREKLRRLPCSHDFHSKCIDKWLKSNKTCPVCRDEVKAENNKPYTP